MNTLDTTLRTRAQTFKQWKLRLILLVIASLLVIVFLPDNPIQLIAIIVMPACFGVFTILYVRQLDVDDVEEQKSVLIPILLALIASLFITIFVGRTNMFFPQLFNVPSFTSFGIQLLVATLLVFVWVLLAMFIPYKEQLNLFQDSISAKSEAAFEETLDKFKDHMSKLIQQNQTAPDVVVRELPLELSILFEDLNRVFKARRMTPREPLIIGVTRHVALYGALFLPILINLAGKIFNIIVFTEK